jgi:hypothetical protein
MKTKAKTVIAIFSLIIVLGVGLFIWAEMPRQVTIAVTGQPGMPFAGVIKADGTAISVAGVVPTNYVVTARSIDCRLEKQQTDGKLAVRLTMSCPGGVCSVSTSDMGRGVTALLSLHDVGCSAF